MNASRLKQSGRDRRHKRIRTKIFGTKDVPRLSVYRSNRYLYAQLIDDEAMTTIAHSSTEGVSGKSVLKKAHAAGKEIAKKAKDKKIHKVVFDRGGFIYAGKIKALAEGARDGGLLF
ncbi:50S ribosomal protein L18 [Candidatus Parcubacteria bacterium]|nr:50S ribosomal protein L18 [Candidatus Parcubacteria bacterium]